MDHEKLLEEVLPRVKEQVAQELRARVLKSLEWEVETAIKAEIVSYLKESVVPEVTKQLSALRQDLISEMVAAVSEIATHVGATMRKEMTDKAVKNLAGGSIIQDIFQKVMRGY